MRILQVALGEQRDIEKAFKTIGEVYYWDWSGYDSFRFNNEIVSITESFAPDVIFLHIQHPGILLPEVAKHISKKAFVINWTGDVRHPLPEWYKEIGKCIDISLFSNMNDVKEMRSLGINSDYLQIGFPTDIFKPDGTTMPNHPEIVFMGANNGQYPLSPMRAEMVRFLEHHYYNNFIVYGSGWGEHRKWLNQQQEAAAYRSAKIGINISHFEYERYSSDRNLRLLGSGCMCLSHHYPAIESEFEVGSHLDTWRTLYELKNKIDHYLANDKERKKIAAAGSKYVHDNCTWINRIEQLKPMIKIKG